MASEKDQAPPPATRRKSPTLAFFQLAVAFLLVVAVGWGLWQMTRGQNSETVNIPSNIAGLSLVSKMTGEQGLAEIRQLHGKNVGVTDGWVAHYENGATIWAGQTQNEGQAYQLLVTMTRRIEAGTPEFKDLERLPVGGHDVFTVTGLGQRHYYYQSGAYVIWIAAPNSGEIDFLKEAMRLIG
ncbi:MAG: hypothetical protein HY664_07805 [Chloroflexi bacterium]|nr:hypothetical protein [Chloroflexota bacterium]